MRKIIALTLAISAVMLGGSSAAAGEPLGKRVYDRLADQPTAEARRDLWEDLSKTRRQAYKDWVRPVAGGIGGGSGAPGSQSVGGAEGAPGTGYTDVIRQVSINPSLDAVPGSGCWLWERAVRGVNFWGWTIWRYVQRMDWCSNGYALSDTFRRRSIDIKMVTWSGEHIESTEAGGAGQSTWRAFTQGKLESCIVKGIGCVQFEHPWVDMKAWADGRWWGEQSSWD